MMGLSRPRRVIEHMRALGTAQLVMTVSLLPLTVWFFGQASLLGAVSNLVAVPWVSLLVVPLTLAGTVLLGIWPAAAGTLWRIAGWLMHGLWALLEYMAQWPGAHWYLPQVGLAALVLAMLGAIWMLLPRGVPARWLGALLFLPLLWPRADLPAPGAFRALAIDVGQGLSVLVRTRHHAMVYDFGAKYPSGFDLGRAAVLPALHALGVRRLDLLMISHGDNDHAGGAPAVAAAFPEAPRFGGEPQRGHLSMKPCRRGQSWSWDGVTLRVLSPAGPGGQTRYGNDRSCVLLVSGRGGRLLLTGDISDRIEPRVAIAVGRGPPLVLLVPHHGSKTSSSAAFIAALRPRLAIVSAGWLNRFGHPAPTVVARYAAAGVPLLNTATSGAIRIRFPVHAPPQVGDRWRWRQRPYWRE
jgi:competence protein ComEC